MKRGKQTIQHQQSAEKWKKLYIEIEQHSTGFRNFSLYEMRDEMAINFDYKRYFNTFFCLFCCFSALIFSTFLQIFFRLFMVKYAKTGRQLKFLNFNKHNYVALYNINKILHSSKLGKVFKSFFVNIVWYIEKLWECFQLKVWLYSCLDIIEINC